jgi:hypothetical protein
MAKTKRIAARAEPDSTLDVLSSHAHGIEFYRQLGCAELSHRTTESSSALICRATSGHAIDPLTRAVNCRRMTAALVP